MFLYLTLIFFKVRFLFIVFHFSNIRCNATEFKLSKSQKKVIKRMNRFLTCGERGKQRSADDDSSSEGPQGIQCLPFRISLYEPPLTPMVTIHSQL